MKLEELLLSTPLDQWRVGQVYNYDWYDGPREGGCALLAPKCEFYFELLAERYNPDGLDDRIYRLSELSAGAVAEMETASRATLDPDPELARQAEQRLHAIRNGRKPTGLVLYAQDLSSPMGCWRIEPSNGEAIDWFTRLNIPQRELAADVDD